MKKNVGTTDRILRLLVAVVIGVLYFQGIISGTLAIVLMVFAVVFAVTAIAGTCPLYQVVGFTTCARKKTPVN